MAKGEYRLRIDGNDVTDLYNQIGFVLREDAIIHIVPVINGAKDAGVFQVIAGAVLIVAGFFSGGATWTAAAYMAGGALVLGGVATMLTPVPDQKESIDFRDSTSFSNLSNLTPQGRPVPLVYGEMMVGSLVIGQGLQTRDVAV